MLGKGHFVFVFGCSAYHDIIFQNEPDIFYLAGLCIIFSKENFISEKKGLHVAPVWILMYSFLQEYWDEETLTFIGHTTGTLSKPLKSLSRDASHLTRESMCI